MHVTRYWTLTIAYHTIIFKPIKTVSTNQVHVGDHPLPSQLALDFFHIPCGLNIQLELYLSTHQTSKQRNKFILEISFFRNEIINEEPEQENFVPHQIEEAGITFAYVWPNQEYQEEEPACATSQILVESEDHNYSTQYHQVKYHLITEMFHQHLCKFPLWNTWRYKQF